MAESTGKEGKGLIPIDREALGPPEVYGGDRIFVYLRLQSAPDATQDIAVDALERAGHPVVRIAVDDPYDLGEEFFRGRSPPQWPARSSASTPSTSRTWKRARPRRGNLTAEYEKTGALPAGDADPRR